MKESLTIETVARIISECHPECLGVTISNVYNNGFTIHLFNTPMDSYTMGLRARSMGLRMFSAGINSKGDSSYTLLGENIGNDTHPERAV